MGHDKIRKFRELNTFPNVLQNFDYHNPVLINHEGDRAELKGQWNKEFFHNENPVTLELACGKGEYTLGLASLYPSRNFIGIDLKGNRIWKGAKKALEEKRKNIAFIRSKIDLIPNYFAPNEISEIWITFPDPFANPTDANRRLTSPYFLDIYRKVCMEGTCIHLKTDDATLFQYTQRIVDEQGCKIVAGEDDIYKNVMVNDTLTIRTYYEGKHLEAGKKIMYLQFVL